MNDLLLQNFGVCTDEVHPDLETALGVAREMGMRHVELLEFWGKPVTAMDDTEIDRARELLDRFEMGVSAIGSLFLKLVPLEHIPHGKVAGDPAFQKDLELLRASILVAKRFEAPLVRTYAFRREAMVGAGNPSPRPKDGGNVPSELLERIVEGLRIAASEVSNSDVRSVSCAVIPATGSSTSINLGSAINNIPISNHCFCP